MSAGIASIKRSSMKLWWKSGGRERVRIGEFKRGVEDKDGKKYE